MNNYTAMLDCLADAGHVSDDAKLERAAGKWRTCVHEAGHATVALAAGWRVDEVRLEDGNCEDGCCLVRMPEVYTNDQRGQLKLIILALAGVLAECEFCGCELGGSKLDEEKAWLAAQRIAPDDATARDNLVNVTGANKTRNIIREHQAALLLMAGILAQVGHVDGREAAKIFTRYNSLE